MGAWQKDNCDGERTYSGGYKSDFHGKNMAPRVHGKAPHSHRRGELTPHLAAGEIFAKIIECWLERTNYNSPDCLPCARYARDTPEMRPRYTMPPR